MIPRVVNVKRRGAARLYLNDACDDFHLGTGDSARFSSFIKGESCGMTAVNLLCVWPQASMS